MSQREGRREGGEREREREKERERDRERRGREVRTHGKMCQNHYHKVSPLKLAKSSKSNPLSHPSRHFNQAHTHTERRGYEVLSAHLGQGGVEFS